MFTRAGRLLVGFGVVVVVVSLLFPVWSLGSVTVSVESIESVPDNETAVDYADLTSREQRVIDEGVGGSEVAIYGRWGAHQNEDADLPFSGTWHDSYTVGTYVVDGGDYYRVAYSPVGPPFHVPPTAGGGVLAGLLVTGLGSLARTSASRGWPRSVSWALVAVGFVVGFVTIVCLLWIGNVEGYLLPVR